MKPKPQTFMAPYSSEDTQKDNRQSTVNYHIQDKKEVSTNLQGPFELLNKYRSQLKRFRNDEQLKEKPRGSNSNHQRLSTESIMRIARNRVIQPKSHKMENLCPEYETNLNLAVCLLTAVEYYSHQKYDQAEELLIRVLSDSRADHPVERIVTYVGRELLIKIDLQKGKTVPRQEMWYMDTEKAVMKLKAAIHECEQRLPFTQITHFTGIQTILDNISSVEIIHFIDVGIKLGSHWIVLMHALANRKNVPLKLLKITAICTSEDRIEETGKILPSFAGSMNLPFEFRKVHSEMDEITKDMFDIDADEVLVVYLELCLMSLSSSPPKIEALIREIKNLNPYMMVVSEVEANITGSTFVNQFHEALVLCSAMFDSLEVCLGRDNECRKIVEEIYYQEIIRNNVFVLDKESFKHCLKIDFWRDYFGRFGIVEMELSELSMHQASLFLKECDCWSSCSLGMNGKCMLIGWNGMPVRSISAWKCRDD